MSEPVLSVVIPTFNNERVLRECIDSWRTHAAGLPVELVVIEDGCNDGTAAYLTGAAARMHGKPHLRWIHMDDAHELRCTNAGFAVARGALFAAWQDDMFVRARWFVQELLRVFESFPDIGMLSLSRGLDMFALNEPIARWEDLHDWRRLQSTIGSFPLNWFRIREVDAVIRPWIVRRACIDRVGPLDEAFVPTEWDEADLAFRIRQAGWKVATYGYERLGAYQHLGSSTLGTLSDDYKQRVLRNGVLFHQRWDDEIARSAERPRETWVRPIPPSAWVRTLASVAQAVPRRLLARQS